MKELERAHQGQKKKGGHWGLTEVASKKAVGSHGRKEKRWNCQSREPGVEAWRVSKQLKCPLWGRGPVRLTLLSDRWERAPGACEPQPGLNPDPEDPRRWCPWGGVTRVPLWPGNTAIWGQLLLLQNPAPAKGRSGAGWGREAQGGKQRGSKTESTEEAMCSFPLQSCTFPPSPLWQNPEQWQSRSGFCAVPASTPQNRGGRGRWAQNGVKRA